MTQCSPISPSISLRKAPWLGITFFMLALGLAGCGNQAKVDEFHAASTVGDCKNLRYCLSSLETNPNKRINSLSYEGPSSLVSIGLRKALLKEGATFTQNRSGYIQAEFKKASIVLVHSEFKVSDGLLEMRFYSTLPWDLGQTKAIHKRVLAAITGEQAP